MADRFELVQPGLDNQYDISVYNSNVQKLAENALKSVNVASLRVMSEEDYALAKKSEDELYLVLGASDFTLYLGTMPMQSGSAVSLSAESLRSHPLLGSVIGAEENTQEV